MTFMTNKIFIDSSILIETYKGNKVEFYKFLFSNKDNQFFINDIVSRMMPLLLLPANYTEQN